MRWIGTLLVSSNSKQYIAIWYNNAPETKPKASNLLATQILDSISFTKVAFVAPQLDLIASNEIKGNYFSLLCSGGKLQSFVDTTKHTLTVMFCFWKYICCWCIVQSVWRTSNTVTAHFNPATHLFASSNNFSSNHHHIIQLIMSKFPISLMARITLHNSLLPSATDTLSLKSIKIRH